MCRLLSSFFVIFVCHLRLASVFVIFVCSVQSLFAEHLLLLTTILFLRPRDLPSLFVLFHHYLHCYSCSLSSFFVHYLISLSSFVIFVRFLRSLSSFVIFVVIVVRYLHSTSSLVTFVRYLCSLSLSFFIVLVRVLWNEKLLCALHHVMVVFVVE
jgi:hypothetical protein